MNAVAVVVVVVGLVGKYNILWYFDMHIHYFIVYNSHIHFGCVYDVLVRWNWWWWRWYDSMSFYLSISLFLFLLLSIPCTFCILWNFEYLFVYVHFIIMTVGFFFLSNILLVVVFCCLILQISILAGDKNRIDYTFSLSSVNLFGDDWWVTINRVINRGCHIKFWD